MPNAHWDFPELNGGQEQGYTNSGIETFKGTELIDNLAREICQNSLDAKNLEINDPVIVKFKLETISKKDFSLFSEYLEYVNGCKTFWERKNDKKVKAFIERVQRTLDNENINLLIASDYNTTGLTGSDASGFESSAWRALVNADGVSAKADGAGGSYGIGKNAPFACSDLSIVFYNTYAKDNKKAFEGVARAATLLNKVSKPTQGIGHYRSTDDYKPITPEISCMLRDKYQRTEYGTDIIVGGCNKFIEDENWKKKLIQATIKNFFLAIYEDKLIVEIEGVTINSTTLPDFINKYRNENKETQLTAQLFDTLTSFDNEINYKKIIEDNDLAIYLKKEKDYKRKIAKFRSSGMLVGIDNCRMIENFNVIVAVRGKKLNEILRTTEPPKHNQWDYKRIEDKEKSKEAKDIIKKINESVKNLINEKYKITPENTFDSEVGEYLPDEIDDLANKKPGNDRLRSIQKIHDKPKSKELPPDINSEIAKKEIGETVENTNNAVFRNEKVNPRPYPKPKPPEPVNYAPEGKDEGINKGEGTKTQITYPHIKLQRIFPINYKIGLYQVMLCPETNYTNLYINFVAVGEGSSRDNLKVDTYTINKQTTKCKGSKIGPISLKTNNANEIFVTFENKEKMVINMDLTEEYRK